MKKLLVLLVLVLLLSCVPEATNFGCVIVTNETTSAVDVTVDGVSKSVPGLNVVSWDLEWYGDPWKTIIISIPGDAESYELWNGEVVDYVVH